MKLRIPAISAKEVCVTHNCSFRQCIPSAPLSPALPEPPCTPASDRTSVLRRVVRLLAAACAAAGLIWLGMHQQPLFHVLADSFSSIIGFSISVVAVNTYPLAHNNYFLYMGVTVFFVSCFNFLHCLIFTLLEWDGHVTANLELQFLIVAKTLQNVSLLTAFFFLFRPVRSTPVIAGFTTVSLLALAAIYTGVFPDCFLPGQGVTLFKQVASAANFILMVVNCVLLLHWKGQFPPAMRQCLLLAFAALTAGQAGFFFSSATYDWGNIGSHLAKTAAYYLFYKAIVQVTLTSPYGLLFQSLTQMNDDLVQRTRELEEANRQLTEEITERTKAEINILRINKKITSIFNSITDGFLTLDNNWQFTFVNREAERLLGKNHAELLGHSITEECLLPEDSVIYQTFRIARQSSRAADVEGYVPRFAKWLEFHIYPSNAGMSVYFRDITAVKAAEATIKRNELHFKTLVENIPDLIVRFDREGRYVYVNPAFEHESGQPTGEFLGKRYNEAGLNQHQCIVYADNLNQVLTSGRPLITEYNAETANGTRSYLSHLVPELTDDGAVESVLVISRDITDRKQMEREMARLDRLHLVGEMAAGIGHEVRNPMTTVRGFLQMLENKKDCAPYKEFFGIMIEELDRANSIITEFLSLAKNKTIHLQLQALNSIVKAVAPLLQADAIVNNKYVRLELGNVPNVLLDKKEIIQLILNLARNGLEAMKSGGYLTLKTYSEGTDIILAVSDQGPGIPNDVLEKLGTPFFTTKETGTGLGLAVCYSIATRHNASITIDTGRNGTTFYIHFPASTDSANPFPSA